MSFKISIPCDNDGYLRLTCPACSEDFKVLCDDFQDDTVLELYCPYCGLSASTNDYLPEDVMEAAYREAGNQAMKMIEKSLGKMTKELNKSGFIKAEIKSKFKENAKKELMAENNMKPIIFKCCEKEVRIQDSIPHSVFYCCYCGVNE